MRRGEVVSVNWPFSDYGGAKVRPAVVVRADFLDGVTDDVALVKITGRAFGIPGTEVRLDPATETLSGLTKACYACCYELLTRDEALILDTVGVLSDVAMSRIDDCLKECLELP
jgi:mRNA-degrading endonuclease toxin of MazEF toxin-antitoxin module